MLAAKAGNTLDSLQVYHKRAQKQTGQTTMQLYSHVRAVQRNHLAFVMFFEESEILILT